MNKKKYSNFLLCYVFFALYLLYDWGYYSPMCKIAEQTHTLAIKSSQSTTWRISATSHILFLWKFAVNNLNSAIFSDWEDSALPANDTANDSLASFHETS